MSELKRNENFRQACPALERVRCYDWEIVCPHCSILALAEIPMSMSPQQFLAEMNSQGCPRCGNKCLTDKLNEGRKPRHANDEDEQ